MDGCYLACYEEWYQGQVLDLDELVDAVSAHNGNARTDAQLRDLVIRSMRLYEDYFHRRRVLVLEDGPTFYCPPWCSSFETAFLWLGGCRPSLFIRLLYSLSSTGLESHTQGHNVSDPLSDDVAAAAAAAAAALSEARGGILALSATQLEGVNRLHCRTLQEEDRLSSRMATLQEDVADRPLLPIVSEHHREIRMMLSRGRRTGEGTSTDGEAEGARHEVVLQGGVGEEAIQGYAGKLARMVGEADELRITTARELLMEILTPKQAVELLVAAKQLHISMHEWGRRRDINRGRG